MAEKKRSWTHDEVVVACALYSVVAGESLSPSNPKVAVVAEKLNLSPGSLSMRLRNFASLDPESIKRGQTGLSNIAIADRQVWTEFQKDPAAIIKRAEEIIGPLS